MKEDISNIQIDAVIPWVNGNDKGWQKKINKYKKVKIDFDKKEESVRYNSIGEIDITIKSIIKYAPFFRTIFLVTDNQIPFFFEQLKELANSFGVNLEIIDHKIIFEGFEDYLPCFNSTSIISLLHRIPKLSEHYVIFNDDTFIMKETTIEDFFIDGFPVLRGKWQKYYENRKIRKLYYSIFSSEKYNIKQKKGTIKEAMQAGAKLAKGNKKVYLRRFHTPISIRKHTLENYFNNNFRLLENNIKYKFRDNKNQFITETLANHLEIKNNTYHFKIKTQLTYFRSYKSLFFIKLKLFCFLRQSKNIFMTFQSLELADEKTLNYIFNWIDKRIN